MLEHLAVKLGIGATLLLPQTAQAQDQTPPWVVQRDLPSAEYQPAAERLADSVYRLRHVAGAGTDAGPRFSAVWHRERRQDPAWRSRRGLSGEQLAAWLDAQRAAGYGPAAVDGYLVAGAARFAALVERVPTDGLALVDLSGPALQAEIDARRAQGLAVVSVSGYTVAGEARYAATWRRDRAETQARVGIDADALRATVAALTSEGWRPAAIDGFETAAGARYAVVLRRDRDTQTVARLDLTAEEYDEQSGALEARGFRPLSISPYTSGGVARYAGVWELVTTLPPNTAVAVPTGRVTVREPGTNRFVEVDGPAEIPLRSTVDVSAGAVTLVVKRAPGATSAADVSGGVFRLTQSKGRRPVTRLRPRTGRCAAQASASRSRNRRASRLRLRTRRAGRWSVPARYSNTSSYSTAWTTVERCGRTTTIVRSGRVRLFDRVRRRTVVLRRGDRYTARARPAAGRR